MATLRERVYLACSARCWFCGIALPGPIAGPADGRAHWTLDHLEPVHRGGRSTVKNLVAACVPCNGMKGPQTLDEFRLRIALFAGGASVLFFGEREGLPNEAAYPKRWIAPPTPAERLQFEPLRVPLIEVARIRSVK